MRRFRELAVPGPRLAGWLIGVLVREDGAPEPVRHFYAVGQDDRERATWAACDRAMLVGDIISSPWRGTEPVEVMKALGPHAFEWSGLASGEVRALGVKWPRRWLTA